MRPHFYIFFLIAFSSFLHVTCVDSQAAQHAEKQPEVVLESDTGDDWARRVSWFNPAKIADKIQGKVQPETQASPNSPDSGPELLPQNLETLFFEETGKIIRSFETMINSNGTLGTVLHEVLESASSDSVPSSNAPFIPLLKRVAKLVAIARDDFQARFPLPATAPGHAERVKHVSAALEHLQQLVIRLARDHEIEKDVIKCHLAHVKSFLLDLGVLIGDVAELYPVVIEVLVLNISAVLLPEAMFLRSLVILYCFGSYVLGKDAISGWLLEHVSEAFRI